MSNSGYILERRAHGWLLCSVPGVNGIPMNAFEECAVLFPKNAVIDSAIAHHVLRSENRNVVLCIVTPEESRLWRQEITESIKSIFSPQERWWKGLDVGSSSAAIFAVFCDLQFTRDAREYSRQSIPLDAADFGRCKRLLDLFPEWRVTLSLVGSAYPDTAWSKIIARWAELEAATPERQSEILRTI